MAAEAGDPPHRYKFPLSKVPRLPYDDPQAQRLISAEQPVVLTGSDLVDSALHWNLDYLSDNMANTQFTVYQSDNNYFKYYESRKIPQQKDFVPPTIQMQMSFSEFVEKLKEAQCSKKHWLYLQQPLTEGVGDKIVQDFVSFNWRWISMQQKENNWGPLSSNLLLVGMAGNITPVHYDEQQNFFAQLRGVKRCLLFAPDQFKSLYPFPVYHPHDRQSQVNLENPNLEKFPKVLELKGFEATLHPGDVLYIPIYWWHQIESLPQKGVTISINFWYKVRNSCQQTVTYPLAASQKIAIMRNIEKMVTDALGDINEVAPFMRTMVLGRYT
ncbi:hypoxia-inducible factor 1-alpha inhibitor [Octopus bimaculoides]|uniref:JmjC domain-containing protein n=1 Tax=Octopus bimaculoides TaxID=37653 RepID=A0A0L8HHA8_OCTBM|nr:hypoxia-inducible factor 1-alpha inhibitor [Octopus bimaculoides]|eukprot:XP_014772373.1 PREDICTED: hypoxia-inducible factor 1-alpha inhibitor-like [Octopus bimaculoides]